MHSSQKGEAWGEQSHGPVQENRATLAQGEQSHAGTEKGDAVVWFSDFWDCNLSCASQKYRADFPGTVLRAAPGGVEDCLANLSLS